MKKTLQRPIGIDLFAGVGGLSLGFEQAGFDVVAAVEIDPVHAAAHKYNFPDCAVLPSSVADLTGESIRQAACLGDKTVDIVFGGAPCQGFSMIGQRAIDDPRNRLVREFVRLVRELDANYFAFENVKGLTVGKHRKFLDELIEEFEKAGYEVRRDWRVLNACEYGVPQDRQRLFLLGAKKGLCVPEYPSKQTCKPGSGASALPSAPTCGDALDDLPDIESFRTLVDWDEVATERLATPSPYASEMRCTSPGSWHFGYRRKWNPSLLTSSMRSNHSDISRRRFAATQGGNVEPISRFLKLAKDGVSNTLRAGTDAARGAFTSPRPIHYRYNRCISVREMARLHGFPDWFRFNRTKWHGARQIGNAVPPPLARAVASSIIAAMDLMPSVPPNALALGDDSLLGLDITSASAYWGVENPIRQRDRKSGARKRRQQDIEGVQHGLPLGT